MRSRGILTIRSTLRSKQGIGYLKHLPAAPTVDLYFDPEFCPPCLNFYRGGSEKCEIWPRFSISVQFMAFSDYEMEQSGRVKGDWW